MDNFHFDITSEGFENLRTAFRLFRPNTKVVGYRLAKKAFILYWYDSDKMTRLPFAMSLEGACKFVFDWLQTVDYGPEPDHDGSNGKGWRISNDAWNLIDSESSAFVRIEPQWAMYGK